MLYTGPFNEPDVSCVVLQYLARTEINNLYAPTGMSEFVVK